MRALSARAKAMVESWNGIAVTPRDAATVVLLRPCEGGFQVFLMRRQPTMNFAAGMHVFPGGSVEDADADPAIGWIGPAPAWWADKFGCTADLAGALVVAAVRETFEETGILLAGSSADPAIETDMARYSHARAELENGSISFTDFLSDSGLSMRVDLLGPWAHWVTPEFEPRRFDTRFFVAMLPGGQRIGDLASEADHAIWLDLHEAYRAGKAGELPMMPPTIHTIRQLLTFDGKDLIGTAATREVTTVAPKLVRADGQYFFDRPDTDEF
ncbi:NUDIX domain-containing protein [Nocardia sp. CA2R105]|uniref:NUDIX hydrolase n=1 Tax=Nocardia coffeae TaxID=2873381 RepID=UPI001CA60A30|nr:NUDIX domain-containing protein [Nocardia coffeae]MBY8862938.1 NUDIX domain-containing protein [Nocardia coffeae]